MTCLSERISELETENQALRLKISSPNDLELPQEPKKNEQSSQGMTKTALNPIFEDSDLLGLTEAYEIALKNGFDSSGNYKKPPKERFRQLFRKVGDCNYGIEKVKDDKGGAAKNYTEI